MVIPVRSSVIPTGLLGHDKLIYGRALSPVGRTAFKAVEVRNRAWWVRLLPLPPKALLTI